MQAKRLRSEKRREQIVETAISHFAKDGFDGTTTKAIAESCGIDESLIYSYFGTKEDLFTATVGHLVDRMTDYFNSVRARSNDPVECLRTMNLEKIQNLYAHPDLAVGAIRESQSARTNTVQRDYNLKALGLTMDTIEEMVAQAQKDGQFKADVDPATVACFIEGYFCFMLQVAICGLQDRITLVKAEKYWDDLLNLWKKKSRSTSPTGSVKKPQRIKRNA